MKILRIEMAMILHLIFVCVCCVRMGKLGVDF